MISAVTVTVTMGRPQAGHTVTVTVTVSRSHFRLAGFCKCDGAGPEAPPVPAPWLLGSLET